MKFYSSQVLLFITIVTLSTAVTFGVYRLAHAGTVIEGWPDVIVCNQPTYGKMVFTILAASSTYTGGTEQTFYGAVFPVAGIQQDIYFNSATGNVDGNNEGEASDCDTDGSISAIIAAGRAYDFGYSTTTVISTTTNTTVVVSDAEAQAQTNLYYAFVLFFTSMFGMIWLMRKH